MALLLALGTTTGFEVAAADASQNPPEASKNMEQAASLDQQRLRIVLGTSEFQARLYDTPATRDFLSRLPLTIAMGDISNKEKYAAFPGGLSEAGTLVYHNEPGQLVYWPTDRSGYRHLLQDRWEARQGRHRGDGQDRNGHRGTEGRGREAGAVSALTGALLYGGGMVGTALVGAFADGTPRYMGIVIALCGMGSLLCTRLLPQASVLAAHQQD